MHKDVSQWFEESYLSNISPSLLRLSWARWGEWLCYYFCGLNKDISKGANWRFEEHRWRSMSSGGLEMWEEIDRQEYTREHERGRSRKEPECDANPSFAEAKADRFLHPRKASFVATWCEKYLYLNFLLGCWVQMLGIFFWSRANNKIRGMAK